MRLPHSLWIMLKLMRSDDSAAENSFTGMDTRPKAICAVAMALGMTTPQHSLHIRCFSRLFHSGRPNIVQIAIDERKSSKNLRRGQKSAEGPRGDLDRKSVV